MLENLAKAIEEAKRQGGPRREGMLNSLRRQNDQQLRRQWEQQQRQALAAQEMAARQVAAARKQAAEAVVAATAEDVRPSRPTTADARAISIWAKPSTLRSQFLLTEILKPPLSMRKGGGYR